MRSLRWSRVLNGADAAQSAPPSPGVYAYAEAGLVHGLPLGLEWVYIGKSKDLRSRLSQHAIHRERYAELRLWLKRASARETWFAAVPLENLDQVERDLITKLDPRLNRVRYLGHAD